MGKSINYAALRGRIVEKYGTAEAFAKAFGISPQAMSNKLNGRSEWSRSDFIKATELLHLDGTGSFFDIFFCKEN